MTLKAKIFSAGFLGGLILALFLNLLPYWKTKGVLAWDGAEYAGFPFHFYERWAGDMLPGATTNLTTHFLMVNLLGDIGVGLAFAIISGVLCVMARNHAGSESGV